MLGRAFGNWVVLDSASPAKNRKLMFRCRCVCGREREVLGSNLRRGKSLGCGCVNSLNRIRPYEALYNYFLTKTRGHEVGITYEDFVAFTSTHECHYCGAGITWSKHHHTKHGSRYNLDRKDNGVGYINPNLVVCCARCNRAKLDHFTYEQFLVIGNLIRGWEGRDAVR